jgi:hypothetical protein
MNALAELIATRDEIVTDYDGGSAPIMRANEVTSGVSPFPGGSGFLSGQPGPRRLMILCHNYDGSDNADKPEDLDSSYWETLRLYVAGAGIREDATFVTNLLMGRKPGKAKGKMADYCGVDFVAQCLRFLDEQIRIVEPEVVAVCGLEILPLLDRWGSSNCRRVDVTHPSAIVDDYNRPALALRSVNLLRQALGRVKMGLDELTMEDKRVNPKVYGRTHGAPVVNRSGAPSLGSTRGSSDRPHSQTVRTAGTSIEAKWEQSNRSEDRRWSGLWHVNAGTHEGRSWDDARRYGFLSAGYGTQWRDEMLRLSLGDHVYAYINGAGYCGGGYVVSVAVRADQFAPPGGTLRLSEVPLNSELWLHDANDDELAEYIIGIAWDRTTSEADGLRVRYAIRGTVRRIYDPELAEKLQVTFG